jgi:hypothetical protein
MPHLIDVSQLRTGTYNLKELVIALTTGPVRLYPDNREGWIIVAPGIDAIHTADAVRALYATDAIRFASPHSQTGVLIPEPITRADTLRELLRDKLDNARVLFEPALNGVYRLPAVCPDGAKFTQVVSGIQHGRCFVGKPINTAGAPKGCPLLRSLMSNFYFESEVFRANLIGYMFALLTRPFCPSFPALVIDGKTRKVGKTTLAATVVEMLLGCQIEPFVFGGGEQEIEKKLGGRCNQPGPNAFFIDNIRPRVGGPKAIRSQLLSVAVTTSSFGVRKVYGKKTEPIDYPVAILTMNHASVENDLHDRVVRVILNGKPGRMFKRHPLRFMEQNRLLILKEMIAHLEELELDTSACNSRFGMFEWVATTAAKSLGLSPNYDPDAVHTPDGAVLELRQLVLDMTDECGGPPAAMKIAGTIKVKECAPELLSLVQRAATPTQKSIARNLVEFVKSLDDRQLYYYGKIFKFVLDKDSTGRYTISVQGE